MLILFSRFSVCGGLVPSHVNSILSFSRLRWFSSAPLRGLACKFAERVAARMLRLLLEGTLVQGIGGVGSRLTVSARFYFVAWGAWSVE